MVVDKEVIAECRNKLIEKRSQILNSVREASFADLSFTGDEGDQSVSVQLEKENMAHLQRNKLLLVEIDAALGRIESGHYGVCEETDEPIEMARLQAIPWTRLSIEGAEIREQFTKRFAIR